MDASGNKTSVDTYDSNFTIKEIAEQTEQHFKELDALNKCVGCLWWYEGSCVSENLEDIYYDKTYMTGECIGFLRKDYMEHMIDMKSRLLAYVDENKDNKMYKYIFNMSYNDTLTMYEKVFNS